MRCAQWASGPFSCDLGTGTIVSSNLVAMRILAHMCDEGLHNSGRHSSRDCRRVKRHLALSL